MRVLFCNTPGIDSTGECMGIMPGIRTSLYAVLRRYFMLYSLVEIGHIGKGYVCATSSFPPSSRV